MSSREARFPEQALAEGFAHHVARWAHERNVAPEAVAAVAAAAREASLATSAGHVCTHLADIAAASGLDAAGLREALLASGLVATPEAAAGHPLVLDREGRVYLHRYFDYERRLARRLLACARAPAEPIDDAARALLDPLFAANAARLGARPDWQKVATALALQRRLTIVSGGPGTGKTTTVVNVLACVLAANPAARIRLAAPTGKAAARMLDATRRAAAGLPAPLRECLPSESFTIHRLLGVRADGGRFRHHAGNPLPLDLLVVDEASMLDLALATKLAEAVPPAARIVLLGDMDQLAAVESGAVFAELSGDPSLSAACVERLSALAGVPASALRPPSPVKPTPLRDSVVWLTENFRFAADSGIGRLAANIKAGAAQPAVELLRSAADPALEWIEDTRPTLGERSRRRILAGMAAYLAAAQAYLARAGADHRDPTALFEALGRCRVLCAERAGARGVTEVNRFVAQHVRDTLEHPLDPGPRSEWYPGRPVMVLRNDYVLKLFNGDVGIVLPDASSRLMACFPAAGGGFRAVAPLRLPEHETAFATTVHKAQGSEFEEVLLLLPAGTSRVVTRELAYTAVTRARSRVVVVGSAATVETAIATPTQRYSGLVARLVEELG